MVMEDHPGSAEPNHPSFLSQARVGGEMVTLYPNPTVDGRFILSKPVVEEEGMEELLIFDAHGRRVYAVWVPVSTGSIEINYGDEEEEEDDMPSYKTKWRMPSDDDNNRQSFEDTGRHLGWFNPKRWNDM